MTTHYLDSNPSLRRWPVFVFRRFRQIEKLNKETMQSHDTAMSARQNRIRRKLYFMTLAILFIVVPLTLTFFVLNIIDGWAYWSQPYDFNAIHYGPDPFNTYFISFTTSDLMRSVDMNVNYIPALTGIVTFFVFGTTADSLNSYRKMLLCFGLGYIFPRLREEYRPADGRRSAGRSWLSSISRVFPGRGGRRSSNSGSSKMSILPTVEHFSQSSRSGNQSSQRGDASTSKSDTMCSGARQGVSSPPIDTPNPWPDLSPHTTAIDAPPAPPQPAQHNPWVLRTVPSPFPLKFPSRHRSGDISESKPIRLPSFKKQSPITEKGNGTEKTPSPVATGTITPHPDTTTNTTPPPPALGVDTRVWAATPPATPAGLPEQKAKDAPPRQNRSDEHLDVVRIQTETRTTSFTVPPPGTTDPSTTTAAARQTAGLS